MSEHNHECGCGCGGHDHDHEELEDMFVTLETDEGELECEVVAIFQVDEEQYIAVSPVDEESEDLYFFRLEPDDENDDEAVLVDIEDDDELEDVAEAFQELLEEQDWDDLTEE